MDQNDPDPFTAAITLADLTVLLKSSEKEEIDRLYQLCNEQMDNIGLSVLNSNEGKKMREVDQEVRFEAFHDTSVQQYLEAISSVLFEAGWRHVSGRDDDLVLQREILTHIFKDMYRSGRPWRPCIALSSHPGYETYNFQELFKLLVEKPLPHDGSTSQKNLRDANQAGIALHVARYSRYLKNPINHLYDDNTPFFLACQEGNLHMAKNLHLLGKVDLRASSAGSPLQVAEQNGHHEILEWASELEREP